MISMTIGELAKIVDGKVSRLDAEKVVHLRAEIDSRKVDQNSFFAAFKGEVADGHDYAASAIEAGAPFVLASKEISEPNIQVADVQKALTDLAIYNREKLQSMKVIGITGSQGKTTTKDLASHLLKMLGNTVAPVASLNNELGVPLLILQCDEDTKYCIVEMGARHKGDITYLCRVAKPEIGVVLVVGNAHVGEFGSREKIAETKKELIDSLPENGCAILGGYDEYTSTMADGRNIKKLSFGENSQCEIRATDIELREGRPVFDLVTPTGRASISLQMLGEHNIANALAAASIATELGMSIESIASGLSSAIPSSKWRMEITEIDEISIINDSYNANTESMAGALKTLALLTQERGGVSWAILGKMHELGASESEEHRKVGKIASDLGIDHLISIGVREYLEPLKGGDTTGHLVEGQDGALDFVEHFQQGDVILVKASRAEELNLLVDEISAQLKNRGEK